MAQTATPSGAMTLYERPSCLHAQKVKIALREKGCRFETRRPPEHAAEIEAASPYAETPLLIDDGFAVFESTVILEYLEDKHPKPDLLADNPRLAAKARMIEEVMDARYEAIVWGVDEITAFGRASGERAAALRDRARAEIAGLNAWLEAQLSGDWFCPPHFGWADLAVVPCLAAAEARGFGPEPGSNVARWLTRALARPSVAETVAEARAASDDLTRLYRDHRLEWILRAGGFDIVREGLESGAIRFGRDPKA